MKTLLISLVTSVVLCGIAVADEPTEPAAIRREIVELKRQVDMLNARIEALEERLSTLEEKHYPWQREQPFLWDGRQSGKRLPVDLFRRR